MFSASPNNRSVEHKPDAHRYYLRHPLAFAKAVNPNAQMTFVYVSGAGTDSSEKGRLMWARVKGKTENDLMKLPSGKYWRSVLTRYSTICIFLLLYRQ